MKIMQIASISIAMILGLYAILLIGQVWGEWLEWAIFLKISFTVIVLVVSIGIIALILKELLKEKELKDKKFLD